MKKEKFNFTGDGKTKETAICFDEKDCCEVSQLQREYMLDRKVKFPVCRDKNSPLYGRVALEENYKRIYEGKFVYDCYTTTKGRLWFKYDRSVLFEGGVIPGEEPEEERVETDDRRAYPEEIAHTGDGKTKETAICFLNAGHYQDEQSFEDLYLSAHNVEFSMEPDLNSEYFGLCEPDIRHEEIKEACPKPEQRNNNNNNESERFRDVRYIRFFTTKGDLWFKYDRDPIEDTDEYLKWLDEQGL